MQFFRLVRQFVLVETVDLQGLDTLLQNGALLRLKLFLRLALRILGIFIVLYFIYILYEFNEFKRILTTIVRWEYPAQVEGTSGS